MTQSDEREANQLAQLSPRANQEAPVAGGRDEWVNAFAPEVLVLTAPQSSTILAPCWRSSLRL